MLAALVVVALVGGWAYVQVRDSLRDVRAAGLASLLEAEARTLQLWIEEKKADAERWAATPQVRTAGARLAARDAAGTCAHDAQRDFRQAIAPYMGLEEVAVFNLIDAEGRIVSSSRAGLCGIAVAPAFRGELAQVFEGRTVFVRPWNEAGRLEPAAAADVAPLVWVETPIRNADGAVVAALGFGRLASQRFANLLKLSVEGTSREAYAFDKAGRMVTAPRHPRELAAAGGTVAGSALAREAIAYTASEGVLLEPYRNYRGAQVIGAWRWLPEAQLAVAVEIEAAEAYGALDHLQRAFTLLFILVLASMTAAASTSLWALRARLREARRVGAYRIEREIAEGGMSTVYLARHAHLKRVAAVKVLKPHLATDEAVERFRREAQLCSQLAHPNTVEIFDYGTTREGRWYYAMEYLEGLSLEELVRRDGPLPVGRVVHALRQVCGSLAEAHARGWVHRDVKPGNIMLCMRGGQHDVVKVLDFGLVKDVRNPDTRDVTQYSKILGTPLYMAPERLRNPADADARADIYALGAVAFFAIAARAPFQAETDHDIVYRVLNDPAPTLAASGVPGVPEELEALIARCLAKEREARPASVEEVRATLDRIAAACPWSEDDARAWWASFSPNIG